MKRGLSMKDPAEQKHESEELSPEPSSRAQTPTALAANASKSSSPKIAGNFEIGQLVADKYRILSLIGRGGMGCVYEIEHVFLNKHFALKVLTSSSLSSVAILRFQKEAKAAALLDYPSLIRVVEFGLIDEEQPFLLMELIRGKTLAELIKHDRRLPLDTVLPIFKEICLGL